jgi:hypothetical protein
LTELSRSLSSLLHPPPLLLIPGVPRSKHPLIAAGLATGISFTSRVADLPSAYSPEERAAELSAAGEPGYYESLCEPYPSNVEIRDAPRKGRGLFASRDIKIGSIIYLEEPLSVSLAEGRCSWCLCELPVKNEISCPHCSFESYCTDRCRQHAWRLYHRVQCGCDLRPLRDWCLTNPHPNFKLPLLIARLCGVTLQSKFYPCSTLDLPHIRRLASAADTPLGRSAQSFVEAHTGLSLIHRCLHLQGNPYFDLDWYVRLHDVLAINVFPFPSPTVPLHVREAHGTSLGSQAAYRSGLKRSFSKRVPQRDSLNPFSKSLYDAQDPDAYRGGLGSALCVLSAYMNHSCMPTAVLRTSMEDGFSGHMCHVRAVAPLRKGQEVTISYASLSATLAEREEMCRSYGFRCECPRCLHDREEEREDRAEKGGVRYRDRDAAAPGQAASSSSLSAQSSAPHAAAAAAAAVVVAEGALQLPPSGGVAAGTLPLTNLATGKVS